MNIRNAPSGRIKGDAGKKKSRGNVRRAVTTVMAEEEEVDSLLNAFNNFTV